MKKELREQTGMGTYGIPTPPDQEHIGPADKMAEVVEEAMDRLANVLVGPDSITMDKKKRKAGRKR